MSEEIRVKNPLISFIIPACNSEKTLQKCVKSIIQSKKDDNDIEILIVENGSTDDTSEIMDQLCREYPCVMPYHSNIGVSKARNMGIENARGEWIMFIDSDDILLPDALSILRSDLTHINSDIILYGYKKGSYICHVTKKNIKYCGEHEVQNVRAKMLKNPTKYMQVWSKIFKRDIMFKYNLRFCTDMNVSEDSDFVFRYSRFCKCVIFSTDTIYQYIPNASSIMHTFNGTKTRDYINALKITSLSVDSEQPIIKHAFTIYILMHLNIILVREIFAYNNPASGRQKFSYMMKLIKQHIFQQAIESVSLLECFSFRMFPIFLLRCHIYLIATIFYKIRALQNTCKDHAYLYFNGDK